MKKKYDAANSRFADQISVLTTSGFAGGANRVDLQAVAVLGVVPRTSRRGRARRRGDDLNGTDVAHSPLTSPPSFPRVKDGVYPLSERRKTSRGMRV